MGRILNIDVRIEFKLLELKYPDFVRNVGHFASPGRGYS